MGTPFQRSAVEDMSFDVYDGEFLGIIGHTGSGKSTLIQHLNGLLKPTSGQILLHGKDIWAEPKKIRDVRFQVGLVFQYPEYQLFEETVYKDIAFGPTNHGQDRGGAGPLCPGGRPPGGHPGRPAGEVALRALRRTEAPGGHGRASWPWSRTC